MSRLDSLLNTILALLTLFVISAPSYSAQVSGQGTWETTLLGRDLDPGTPGFEAYYDTTLNITWLADANYSETSGYDANGQMFWFDAIGWIDHLNTTNLYGYNQWRLPDVVDVGNDGCNNSNNGTDCGYNVLTTDGTTVYSELASMWYDTLGNIPYVDTSGNANQPGWGPSNQGPFDPSIRADSIYSYWTGLGTHIEPGYIGTAWIFNTLFGYQSKTGERVDGFAWAVHPGDITAVPVPPAVWLLGSGLAAIAVRRKWRRV